MDNWLLIVVAGIFLICIAVGYIRGFLKFGLSLLATLITMILVTFLSPYVSNALVKYTPIDDVIEKKCIKMFMPEISADDLSKINLSGTPLENLTPEQIASLGETDWSKYGLSAEDILSVIGEIPRDEQIKIIENSPVPEFLKNMLLENNNSTIYKELDVTSFPSYVASYISRLVLKVASFLVTFLLAIIIVKALMVAVNIIGELPVLGFVNHLAGGILGLLAALLIVWLIFLGLTLLYSTSVGHTCFGMIEKSVFLKFLYEHNPFLIRLLAF